MNWDSFVYFFSLQDANIRWVIAGVMLVCAVSAAVGCFAFLRKNSLAGDAISHSILPGICVAFLIAGEKNTFFLIIGAFIAGILALFIMEYLKSQTKLKSDATNALVLSVFYAIGIMLLTYIQQTGNGGQSGLDQFLFGRAAALVAQDVWIYAIFCILILLIILLFFNALRLVCFDREYAISIGFPAQRIEMLISIMTVCAIALGIQAVGVVLMVALLGTPAAAARYWTNKMGIMLLLAAFFGAISGVLGAYFSYTLPNMPTGPWIVVVLFVIALISSIVGIKRGVLFR